MGTISTDLTSGLGSSEVFVSTRRGAAALEAAGHAVAAVVQGQGVEEVAIQESDSDAWQPLVISGDDGSDMSHLINLLAGALTTYACGLAECAGDDVPEVRPCDHDEVVAALIEDWDDCPLLDGECDGVPTHEIECLFELLKRRTLRLLRRPNHVRAILALARELLTREEVPAGEATTLIQRHLASA